MVDQTLNFTIKLIAVRGFVLNQSKEIIDNQQISTPTKIFLCSLLMKGLADIGKAVYSFNMHLGKTEEAKACVELAAEAAAEVVKLFDDPIAKSLFLDEVNTAINFPEE